MKKLVVFDLDGTLAVSKQALDDGMAGLLGRLLEVCPVCIISGGDWPQFEKQIVDRMPKGAKLEDLILMPTTGAKLFRFEGAWHQIYADAFSPAQGQRIIAAIKQAVMEAGLSEQKLWGEQIEDRGTQVTFSGLGQSAPPDEKAKWDPDRAKRTKLKDLLDKALGDVSVKIGGATSVDITKPGVDKAYGVHKLSDYMKVGLDEMLFVGDALYPGGNDAPARDAGVPTIGVRDIEDTRVLIETIVTFVGRAVG